MTLSRDELSPGRRHSSAPVWTCRRDARLLRPAAARSAYLRAMAGGFDVGADAYGRFMGR